MYNQQDIILIPFPYSDLTGSKQRPALIISNEKLNKTQDRLCCLITSNNPKDGVKITKESFQKGNLPFQSWIKPQRVFTVHEEIIKRKLCTITKKFHKSVISKLNTYIE